MKKLPTLLLMLVILIINVSAFAQDKSSDAYKFFVEDPMKRNAITIKSEAPLEDIVGMSNEITGYVNFNPNEPLKGGFAELSVPVVSINTGIPLRDEHIQSSSWLNAEGHPNIQLKLNTVKEANLVKETDDARTFKLTVAGEFSLNGVTQKVEIPAQVTYLKANEMTKNRLPGSLLAIRANFSINLSDYNVTGPDGMKIIGAKVANQIDISVNIMGSTELPSMAKKK